VEWHHVVYIKAAPIFGYAPSLRKSAINAPVFVFLECALSLTLPIGATPTDIVQLRFAALPVRMQVTAEGFAYLDLPVFVIPYPSKVT
jgi:hypothetical protein